MTLWNKYNPTPPPQKTNNRITYCSKPNNQVSQDTNRTEITVRESKTNLIHRGTEVSSIFPPLLKDCIDGARLTFLRSDLHSRGAITKKTLSFVLLHKTSIDDGTLRRPPLATHIESGLETNWLDLKVVHRTQYKIQIFV